VRVQVLDELFDDDGVLLLDVVHEDEENAADESRVFPAAWLVGIQVVENRQDYLADGCVVGLAGEVLKEHLGLVVGVDQLNAVLAVD